MSQRVSDPARTRYRHESSAYDPDSAFRFIFERAAIGIALADMRGHLLEINPALCDVLGYPHHELVQMAFNDFTHPDDITLDMALYRELIAGQRDFYTIEKRYIRKDGIIIWGHLNASLVRDAMGIPRFAIAMLEDITEQKRAKAALHESEERFSDAFAYAATGMSLVSLDGRFLKVNRSFCEIVGYPEQELLTRTFQSITHPDDLDADFQSRNQLLHGQRRYYHLEKRYQHQAGHIVCAQISVSLVRDSHGEPAYFFAQIQDITARKQAEERLRHSEQRYRLLSKELAERNADLQQFASIASHDLQEPLATIIGYLQLLQRRSRDQLNADAHDYIHAAIDGATRMQDLINALLTYSRVGTRAAPFAPTDIEQVMHHALANLTAAIEQSHAKITIATPLPSIIGDTTQLTQLFQNLLSNAIKFCGDAPPTITVSAARQPYTWLFTIQDMGLGIPPDEIEHIFLPFKRASHSDAIPGTGIGLAVCQKIVHRHGGTIWVESHPGHGSTFSFTLPDPER